MERLKMNAEDSNLNTVLATIRRCLKNFKCRENEDVIPLLVSAEEIYINIAHYAYREGEIPSVEIQVEATEHYCRLTFKDHGTPYNPLAHEDPDITLDSMTRPIGGLGILMVKEMMDDVAYKYEEGYNQLMIEKRY